MTASGKTSRCTPWCASSSSPPTSTPGSGAPWTPCATRPTSKNSGPAEPRRGRTGEPPLLGRQARLSDRPHGLQGQLAKPVAAGHGGRGLGLCPASRHAGQLVRSGLGGPGHAVPLRRHPRPRCAEPGHGPGPTGRGAAPGRAGTGAAVVRTAAGHLRHQCDGHCQRAGSGAPHPGRAGRSGHQQRQMLREQEWVWGYRETDPMGGYDPYSASKGCTELVVASYRRSFLNTANVPVASARAGNVIGGGDWTPTRLVPDVLAAFSAQQAVTLRQPGAIRPWQHVLEPLSGYLALAQRLHEQGMAWAEGWNFGPHESDARTVGWVVQELARRWGPDARWQTETQAQPHEAHTLKLDCSKAHSRLGWQPRWRADTALQHTLDWHRAWQAGADMRQLSLDQITEFESAA